MARYAYDRLSGQDNNFLLWETPSLPMHVGGTQIFEAGPLRNEHGGIRFERIKQLTESLLHRIPRYRQKLAWIPGEEHAVWVDDEHFNLHYHFRHTALPRPGTDEQLKRLTARIMEHPLDRSRPLWETWVVEGLEGDRFALINKIHHCVIDGASGVDLSQILLSTETEREIRPAPHFYPRPVPRGHELRADEWRRRLRAPIHAANAVASLVRESPSGWVDEIGQRLRSLGSLAQWKATPVSETPINGLVGPHRIVDWRRTPLAHFKAIRKAAGCTINDVLLTTVTGAVRAFMRRRLVDPDRLEFRTSTPVNVRGEGDRAMGNRVSSWLVRLPIACDDPLDQLESIKSDTRALKLSNQAAAVEMVTILLDWLPFNLQNAARGTINMVVSNVPGPPFPLYLLGAEMKEIVPLPPLLENVGLGVAVLSYNGHVFWGFNADYDLVPDVEDFGEEIETAFARLAEAVGVDLSRIEPPPAPLPEGLPAPQGWRYPATSESEAAAAIEGIGATG